MSDDKNILIWALLLFVLLACIFWHVKENRHLMRQWREHFGEESAQWLIRFAWSRTIQVWLALSCLAIIAITYDWQLSDTRRLLTGAIKTNNEQQQKIADLIAQVKTVRPAQITPPVAPQQPAASPYPPSAIEDVYNPEENSSGKQSAMDSIKKRYEEILVTYFYLKKCNRTNPTDYHVIISALSQEMASVNAPGRLQHDIVTAAQGSYKEMYSQNNCTTPDMITTYNRYADYIDSLSKNFVAQ